MHAHGGSKVLSPSSDSKTRWQWHAINCEEKATQFLPAVPCMARARHSVKHAGAPSISLYFV